MRGLPQLPLLPVLPAVHVVGAAVRRGDEHRGVHGHPEGGRDSTQRAAAPGALDHAGLRWVGRVSVCVALVLVG